MKKALLITYYWPPSGSSAVQRVLKFAKYLPEFGWQPIILTVDNGEYNAIDQTFNHEIPTSAHVYRTKAFEPHNFYRKITGSNKDDFIPVDAITEKNVNWQKKFSFWLRANLFVPDARIGWIPYAVKQGKKIIRNHNVDVIFSSSPPPTVHLIARSLAKWSGLRWIVDFRDPWVGIHYLKDIKRLPVSQKLDESFEKSVLNRSNAIVSVSNRHIKEDLAPKIQGNNKCHFIPNGYDEQDFDQFFKIDRTENQTGKINITHVGTIGEQRIPFALFNAIGRLAREKKINPDEFKVTFVGKTEQAMIQAYNELKIEDYIQLVPYIPHNEIFDYLNQATMLLLLTYSSKKNIPGKTFEYLRVGKPILAFGPEDSELNEILADTAIYEIIDYNNSDKAYNFLRKVVNKQLIDNNGHLLNKKNVERFERKNLTKQLVELFDAKSN